MSSQAKLLAKQGSKANLSARTSGTVRSSRMSRRSYVQAVQPDLAVLHARIVDPLTGKDATPLPLLGARQQGPVKAFNRGDQSVSYSASRTSGGGTTPTQSVDFQGLSSIQLIERFSSQMGISKSIGGTLQGNSSSYNASVDDSDSSTRTSGTTTPREDQDQEVLRKPKLDIVIEDESGPVDPDATVEVSLQETETFTLFYLPAKCVQTDGPSAAHVTERNKNYTELKKKKVGNDMYAPRAMQTFNELSKHKDTQPVPPVMNTVNFQTDSWDIYDTFDAMKPEETTVQAFSRAGENAPVPVDTAVDTEDLTADIEDDGPSVPSESSASQMSAGRFMEKSETVGAESESGVAVTLHTATGTIMTGEDTEEGREDARQRVIANKLMLNSKTFKGALRVMERMITQNNLHPRIAAYRDFSPVVAPEPTLTPLWSYECILTVDRTVTCMGWNPVNHDMLACGYSSSRMTNEARDKLAEKYLGQKVDSKVTDIKKLEPFSDINLQGGLLLIWTLKNVSYPSRVIHTATPVTSCAFSNQFPNLLALGTEDGTVAVYDVKQEDLSEPLVASLYGHGKHSDPVWQVQWVNRGGIERLVSVSSDGRVVEWAMKKGLQATELMKLKRVPNASKLGDTKVDPFIARHAAGMSVAFWPKDANIYVVGTDSGNVHKCSTAYSEQFLESFNGHSGAVYKLKFSPFNPDLFISCSSDWTARLWRIDGPSEQPLCFLPEKSTDAVVDVTWSPSHATVFATTTRDGWLQIWDLRISQIKPVVDLKHVVSTTAVQFGPTSPSVVMGDDSGKVIVYKLAGIANAPDTLEGQLSDLERGVSSSILQ